MNFWKRLRLAAALSWGFAVSLGWVYAVSVSEGYSLSILLLPDVIIISLVTSTIMAILITPIAVWAVRTGTLNLKVYAPIFWVVLAAYLVAATRWEFRHGGYGLLALAVGGLVILGFIPPREPAQEP